MKACIAISLLLCLAGPGCQALVFKASDAKVYPVTKVINLLKDMQAQLEKEADEDEEAYDKMMCWCQTNEKAKTKSISDYQSRVSDLQTTVESSASEGGGLTAEIKSQKADLEQAQTALDTATSIRTKASSEFHSEEKDLLQSIKALDSAIVVLNKHHSGAALVSTMRTVTKVMQTEMDKHEALLKDVITPHHKKLALTAFGVKETKAQPYAPASGEIFGILKQMKETFESNLQASQKQEGEDELTFNNLKSAKTEEISAIVATVQEKEQQSAAAAETSAQAKEDLEDANQALEADSQFLDDLKTRCAQTEEEYKTRTTLRQQEVSACAEAVSILSSDQAHETFSNTFNPALLQIAQEDKSNRAAALAVLQKLADSSKNPKLALLAHKAKLDPFAEVKLSIDQMVKELEQAKKDDNTERDTCIKETNQVQLDTQANDHVRQTVEAKLEGLQAKKEEQMSIVSTMKAELEDLKVQIRRAGEDRQKAHRDYQDTLKDQRETQMLLKKALAVLKSVYKNAAAEGASLLQVQAAPAGFKTFTTEKAGAGILAMLEQIMSDAANMEKDTVRADEEEQKDYEKFVEDSTAAMDKLNVGLIDKNDDLSGTKGEIAQAQIDLRNTKVEAESLANNAKALRMGCDFLIQNYDLRQTAFTQEIDALKQAKAFLSGMKY